MTIYEALINEDKQRPCRPLNPCCEEPCDEPSFWELPPTVSLELDCPWTSCHCHRLWSHRLGLHQHWHDFSSSYKHGCTQSLLYPTYLTQGSRLISIFLGIIGVSAWILFKACSDDWKIVVVGSLVGASGFSLAAIGLLYFTVAQFPAFHLLPSFDPTWFNIARPLIIASIVGFLLLAYLINANRCYGCITAKKAVIVSLIFLSGGWAAWSLGRLLDIAVVTFQFSTSTNPTPTGYVFPSTAFMAFIAVSIINIVLVVALGWYVLGCVADNCFTVFLPLFASAAPLGNWALYRVGLNVLSYDGGLNLFWDSSSPLIQFAYAIGFVSITALLLTFVIANGAGDAFVVAAASAPTLLYPIAIYTYIATASNLIVSPRN